MVYVEKVTQARLRRNFSSLFFYNVTPPLRHVSIRKHPKSSTKTTGHTARPRCVDVHYKETTWVRLAHKTTTNSTVTIKNNTIMKAITKSEQWRPRRTACISKRQRTHTEETVSEDDEGNNSIEHTEVSSLQRKTSSSHKSVTFSTTVCVYHHPLILGDHPGVRNGVPLMLDWSAVYTEYRSLRDNQQSSSALVPALSLYVREVLAQQAGATREELRDAREQVRAIQTSRQESAASRRWWWWLW